MKSNRKYFYVFDRKVAETIREITNEVYYKYTNHKGETYYSFINSDEVYKAYKCAILMKKRLNGEYVIKNNN